MTRKPMNSTHHSASPLRSAFTLMELIVVIAILVLLAALSLSIVRTARGNARLAEATERIRALGTAFVGYTADHGGLLPLEDAPGPDDWSAAQRPENAGVWYISLPKSMSAASLAEIAAKDPALFYRDSNPLYIPGAPYPKGEERLKRPMFAIAMSSRLQRKDDDGYKAPGTLGSILEPTRTVAFLERGMPRDDKLWQGAQRGYDAGPKANPRAFTARHNQKGLLLFVDGHCQAYQVPDLITPSGLIIQDPSHGVLWTRNPADDPN